MVEITFKPYKSPVGFRLSTNITCLNIWILTHWEKELSTISEPGNGYFKKKKKKRKRKKEKECKKKT